MLCSSGVLLDIQHHSFVTHVCVHSYESVVANQLESLSVVNTFVVLKYVLTCHSTLSSDILAIFGSTPESCIHYKHKDVSNGGLPDFWQ